MPRDGFLSLHGVHARGRAPTLGEEALAAKGQLQGTTDELGIARAPVIGGSAGALAAMQFAIRHPDRCSALVAIVPATFAPGRLPPRPNALGRAIMDYALKSDFLFGPALWRPRTR